MHGCARRCPSNACPLIQISDRCLCPAGAKTECIRKLAIVCLPVFFQPAGSVGQLIFGLVVCFVTFGTLMVYAPYVDHKDDYFAQLCQVQVFFLLLSSLALKSGPGTLAGAANLDYLLVGLLIFPVFFGLYIETGLHECMSWVCCYQSTRYARDKMKRSRAFLSRSIAAANRTMIGRRPANVNDPSASSMTRSVAQCASMPSDLATDGAKVGSCPSTSTSSTHAEDKAACSSASSAASAIRCSDAEASARHLEGDHEESSPRQAAILAARKARHPLSVGQSLSQFSRSSTNAAIGGASSTSSATGAASPKGPPLSSFAWLEKQVALSEDSGAQRMVGEAADAFSTAADASLTASKTIERAETPLRI